MSAAPKLSENQTESVSDSPFTILTVGISPDLRALFDEHLKGAVVKDIAHAGDFEKLIDHYTVSPGTYCFVSSDIAGMSHLEAAQALNSCYPGLNITFVTRDRANFDLEILKKNGFHDYTLLPLDQAPLVELFGKAREVATGGLSRRYKAVKVVDLQANEDLPFGVFAYLPLNNKYVALSGSGQISQTKIDKMQTQAMNSIYIDEKQLDAFYNFTAEKLVQLGKAGNDAVTETEKAERLQRSVRELFRSILDSGNQTDFSQGRDLATSASKIVESYLKKKLGTDLSARLKTILGEDQDSYSQAQAVSAIACLLSLASGIGISDDLAIAGLFAHIGLSGDLEPKDDRKHPEAALNLLKEKKVTISEEVAEIIEKHHERIDGSGFPKALKAHRIPMAAQLLSYAEMMENHTRRRPGRPTLSARAAHEMIAREGAHSEELLSKISLLL